MRLAKKSFAGGAALAKGRLKKREFREFLNAVINAMPLAASAAESSLNSLLAFLRSRHAVSTVTSTLGKTP